MSIFVTYCCVHKQLTMQLQLYSNNIVVTCNIPQLVKWRMTVQNMLYVWRIVAEVILVYVTQDSFQMMMARVKVIESQLHHHCIISICSTDIDECANGHRDEIGHHTCPNDEACINTVGSYTCVCPEGYQLNDRNNRCEGTSCVHDVLVSTAIILCM